MAATGGLRLDVNLDVDPGSLGAGERCRCSSSEACRGDANNRTKSPQFGVFEGGRGWGDGDGGADADGGTGTWERKRGETLEEGPGLLQTHQAWLVTVGVATGARAGGPKAETGSARDWLVTEQNPPCSIRVRAGQPTAFWNVGRLQNTQHTSGLSFVVASSVPGHGQQQISSSNIPGNQLDQSGHQPRVPLRLHLWRWGRLCATMGSRRGEEIAPGQVFFFCRLFLTSALSKQTWRRGGRGGRIESARVWGLFTSGQKGGRTVDSGEMQRAASRLAVARK